MTPLTAILAALCAKSERDGLYHPRDLRHGLIVSILVVPDCDHFILKIWRLDNMPSAVEWRTVVNALPTRYRPDPVPVSTPYGEGLRHVLTASWPIGQLNQGKLL